MTKVEEDALYIIKEAKYLGFSGKSFLITGATGMIGRIFVNALKKITSEKNIYALGFDYQDVSSVYGNTAINLCTFDQLGKIKRNIDYILHLAAPTNPTFLKDNPVETISFIYESTKIILEFAIKHESKVLYISSMETYGEVFDENAKRERDLGYVDLRNTRSSYPEAKRLCELLCYSYSKEYGLSVFVARLAQTFGAGTLVTDSRIFGYLGRCAIRKENVVLKTKGNSYGNYCYISDTLIAFFYILSRGENGETYNVVGDNCRTTILQLAEIVSKDLLNNEINIEFDLSNSNKYPNPTLLNMSNERLKGLGWTPKYTIKDMFIRMIDSWKE